MVAFSTVVSESDRCVMASTSPRWTEGLFESDILFTSLSEESIRTGTSLTKSPGSVGFKTRFTDGDGIPGVVPSKLIAEATTTPVAGRPKLIQRESVGISWQIPLSLRPLRQQMTTYPRTSVMSPVLSANASVGLPN